MDLTPEDIDLVVTRYCNDVGFNNKVNKVIRIAENDKRDRLTKEELGMISVSAGLAIILMEREHERVPPNEKRRPLTKRCPVMGHECTHEDCFQRNYCILTRW
jgi:hypothetical protein